MDADPAKRLAELWNAGSPEAPDPTALPGEIRTAIGESVNASFKLIRYILPSQLLAKLCVASRNALTLQAQSDLPGAFDARSFCTSYITPFDAANHRVLGGSKDPGVGNIWRHPQIDAQWLAKGNRARSGGLALLKVLAYAQEHPDEVEAMLRATLVAISVRLAETEISYPRPNRISEPACVALVERYLAKRTGGRRMQAVAAALFDTIGSHFSLFASVEVGHINKSDVARGDVADLDCRDVGGATVLSVEVKDRQLSVRDVRDTLEVARDRGVAEILYLIRGKVSASEEQELRDLKASQFTAGHNVYDIDFVPFLRACLILFGEKGRSALLDAIGTRTDEFGELSDRQDWQRELLSL